ncbi:hypothetical protein SNE40_011249 [Patella caerulea]|uniref:Uncharacterized protein n=1 Tax=Patella caerulea TaxID=87958 RepID=A0AAN8JN83_PATCE
MDAYENNGKTALRNLLSLNNKAEFQLSKEIRHLSIETNNTINEVSSTKQSFSQKFEEYVEHASKRSNQKRRRVLNSAKEYYRSRTPDVPTRFDQIVSRLSVHEPNEIETAPDFTVSYFLETPGQAETGNYLLGKCLSENLDNHTATSHGQLKNETTQGNIPISPRIVKNREESYLDHKPTTSHRSGSQIDDCVITFQENIQDTENTHAKPADFSQQKQPINIPVIFVTAHNEEEVNTANSSCKSSPEPFSDYCNILDIKRRRSSTEKDILEITSEIACRPRSPEILKLPTGTKIRRHSDLFESNVGEENSTAEIKRMIDEKRRSSFSNGLVFPKIKGASDYRHCRSPSNITSPRDGNSRN